MILKIIQLTISNYDKKRDMKSKLKLKDIACYFPYGLKYRVKEDTTYDKSIHHETFTIYGVFLYQNNEDKLQIDSKYFHPMIWQINPILRPLSDLKEEHYNEIFKTCEQTAIHYKNFDKQLFEDEFTSIRLMKWQFELLFQYHYDTNKLIEKGLAININDL